MIFPIGDTPNPPRFTAWLTYALIALNVAIFLLITLPLSGQAPDPADPLLREYLRAIAPSLPPGTSLQALAAQVTLYDLLVFERGFKPGAPQWGDLFSAMFLHAGFAHLAGNMLFLWIYGDNVEHRLGRLGYLLAYLLTGALSTLAFSLLAGPSLTPLVGASGAISGVLGLYFLLFPRNRVKILLLLFPFLVKTVLVPARWVLAVFVLIDNLLPLAAGAATGVAYGAHLGGFFAGLAVAALGERLAWSWPWGGALSPAPASDPLSPPALLQRASALQAAGRPAQAARTLQQGIHLHRRDPPAHAGLRLALGQLLLAQGQPAAAYQHLLAAAELDPGGEAGAAARELLRRIDPRFLG